MKLIHLPTMREKDFSNDLAEALLKEPKSGYIRAELPQYWRVEGYIKSWGYLCVKENKVLINCLELNWVGYDGIKVEGYSNGHPVTRDMEIISRAEFEYHFYNPWKKVQGGMAQLEKGISNSKLNEQLDMSGGFKNGIEYITVAPIEAPIEPTIEYIKQQAENMGYELVRKVVEESWCGHEDLNNYSLKEYGQIWLQINCPDTREEIRMPEQDIQTLIEKYNQFKK
jgi:hypothetical protein